MRELYMNASHTIYYEQSRQKKVKPKREITPLKGHKRIEHSTLNTQRSKMCQVNYFDPSLFV